MDISAFMESLVNDHLPSSLSVYLQALWFDGKGNWQEAHRLIQDVGDEKAAWIHAYLHRKEGDVWNADYWYSKAGKIRPSISLDDEWHNLVCSFM
ncbi:MAG: hypothetical protein ACTHOF_09175 [Flavisolibacter sp.]|jgi:hypothetical protein